MTITRHFILQILIIDWYDYYNTFYTSNIVYLVVGLRAREIWYPTKTGSKGAYGEELYWWDWKSSTDAEEIQRRVQELPWSWAPPRSVWTEETSMLAWFYQSVVQNVAISSFWD